MDEFIIQLQAELDEAKSKGNINEDIDSLQGKLDELKLQATLDPKAVQNLVKEIEKVINQKIVISNIGVDTGQAVKSAEKTGRQIGNAINQGITDTVSKTNKTLKSFTELKIGTDNIKAILDENGLLDAEKSLNKIKELYSEFGQVKITNKLFDPDGNLKQFRVDIQQVNGDLKESRNFMMALSEDGKSFCFPEDAIRGSESFVHHLNEAKKTTNEVLTEEQKLANIMADVREKTEQTRQAEEKRHQAAQNNAINKALEEEYKQRQKLADQTNNIQLSIGDKGNTTTQIKTLSDSFIKLGLSADEVKTKMSGVDTELATLQKLFNDGADNSAIVSQFNKLKLALNETQNDLKSTRSEYSLLVSDQQRLSKANVIEAWNLKNKNATQDVRSANEAYIASLRDLNTEMTKVKFNEISDGFSRIKNQMTALGKISTAVKGQIAQASASLVSFVSLSRVAMKAVSWLTQMPSTVKTLDTALVDLKKTAKMSAQELENFYYKSNDVAKQMGVTTEEILNQASAWSRLNKIGLLYGNI